MTHAIRSMFMLGVLVSSALVSTSCTTSDESTRGSEWPEDWHITSRAERGELPKLVGNPAPKFTVTNWLHGKELTPADTRGKIVLVDIWATYCQPCLAAIPHNNQLAKTLAAKGVIVVGICTDQDHDQMTAVATDLGISYYCAEDTTGATAKAWKATFYPTYILIDRQGIIRGAGLSEEGVEKGLEKLLAEPSPTSSSRSSNE